VRQALEELKPAGQATVVNFPAVNQEHPKPAPVESKNKKPSEEPSTPQTAGAKSISAD
jgi:hypothetical protein